MSRRTSLPDKILAIHRALDRARIAHAFGGALALAWCTEQARGTIDVDVNAFTEPERAAEVLAALPKGVRYDADDVARCQRDGQVRVWWDDNPVDVFTDTTDFHRDAATRVVVHEFGGVLVPFLACSDLGVFKAFFNRSKDWVDLEAMVVMGTLDGDHVLGVLVRYLGSDDERVERLRALLTSELG